MNRAQILSRTIKITDVLPLTSSGIVSAKGYMWFSAICFNGLCRLNPCTGETVLIGCFPDEEWDAVYLHSQVGYYENKLIFAPNRAKGIDIYDIEKNQFDRILLPCNEMEIWSKDATKVYAMQQWKNRFVLCGLFSPIIIYFDVLSGEVNFVQNMYEKLYGSSCDRKLPIFRKSSCSCEGKAYVLCAQSDQIMKINIKADHPEVLKQIPLKFDTICYDGEIFWISIKNDIYIMKDFKLNKVVSIEEECSFVVSICAGNYIYYISNQQEEITIVNKTYPYMITKIPVRLEPDLSSVDDGSTGVFEGLYLVEQGEIVLLCNKSSTIVFLKDGKISRTVSPFLREGTQELIEMSKEILLKKYNFDNIHEKNLGLWLCGILVRDGNSNLKKKSNVCVGDKIYQLLNAGKKDRERN